MWVVTGGSGAGIEHFERTLADDGYALSKEKQFTGVTFRSTGSPGEPLTVVIFPTDGATVSGNAVLDALVSDSTKVKRVVFQATGSSLHNAIIGTATPKLYGWVAVWDSTKVANGYYQLQSVLVRSDGTRIFSPPIRIHVENKPRAS